MFHDPSLSPVSPLFPPSILSLNYNLTIATGTSTSILKKLILYMSLAQGPPKQPEPKT